jgi:hypothetical protein
MFAMAKVFPASPTSSAAEMTQSVGIDCPSRRADLASSSSSDKTTSTITSGKVPYSQQLEMILITESK